MIRNREFGVRIGEGKSQGGRVEKGLEGRMIGSKRAWHVMRVIMVREKAEGQTELAMKAASSEQQRLTSQLTNRRKRTTAIGGKLGL